MATQPALTALGARVHMFLRPEARQRFESVFRDVLGCDVRALEFGLTQPILFVGFGNGSGFSVEFSDLAPADPADSADPVVRDPPGDSITDATAFRGAWLEFRTTDLAGCQARLREAGIPEFRHPGSSHVYFSAPGGQVFRLLDVSYVGP